MTNGASIKTTDYLDGFQYSQLLLEFFPYAEGYVKATNTGFTPGNPNYAFNYVYNYTDHLGNVRLSYAKDPQTGNLKILDESHYYPFGLKHQEYQANGFTTNPIQGVIIAPVANNPFKYKYNGKEWQDELGLNFYDYGARNYDPALGRWMNMDPLAEKYPQMTPYKYASNTPTLFVDYDGQDFGLNIDHNRKTVTITATYYFDNKENFRENKDAIADWNKLEGTYEVDGEEYTIRFQLRSKIAKEGEDAKELAAADATGNYIGEFNKDKEYKNAYNEYTGIAYGGSNISDWSNSAGFTYQGKYIFNRGSEANTQTRGHEIGHTLLEPDSKTQVGIMQYKESYSLMENVTTANGVNVIQRAFNLAEKQKEKTNSLHQPYSHNGPTNFSVIGTYKGVNFLGGTLNLKKK